MYSNIKDFPGGFAPNPTPWLLPGPRSCVKVLTEILTKLERDGEFRVKELQKG